MAGAALCFFIARILGRGAVEKLTGKTVLNNIDAFFERYGKHTILVCRLLPFVPFDPVSYAAGLTSIRFRHFFIATGIGQLPATIIYSWAGSLLTGGTFWFVTGLFVLFALSVVISVARSLYLERQRKKTETFPIFSHGDIMRYCLLCLSLLLCPLATFARGRQLATNQK